MIEYVVMFGTMRMNVLEVLSGAPLPWCAYYRIKYVDHLHEHFQRPCTINKSGVIMSPIYWKKDIGTAVLDRNVMPDNDLVLYIR